MKTTTIKLEAPKWYIIDATDQAFGRIATEVAHLLRGKNEPTYSPHQLGGGHVIVTNVAKLKIDPRKALQKSYFSHTGYLGHTKATSLQDLFNKSPEQVIEKAVKGMLPNNRLRAEMLKRLHVFTDAEHPHEAQKPTPVTL